VSSANSWSSISSSMTLAACAHLLPDDHQRAQLTICGTGTTGTLNICAGEKMKSAAQEGQGCAEVQQVLQGAAAGRAENDTVERLRRRVFRKKWYMRRRCRLGTQP
jgi:hypothetical protein